MSLEADALRRRAVWAVVRTTLGMGQMMGALSTAFLLYESGLSRVTEVAFTATTVLLCTGLLLK